MARLTGRMGELQVTMHTLANRTRTHPPGAKDVPTRGWATSPLGR
jgi:hypothetical protein